MSTKIIHTDEMILDLLFCQVNVYPSKTEFKKLTNVSKIWINFYYECSKEQIYIQNYDFDCEIKWSLNFCMFFKTIAFNKDVLMGQWEALFCNCHCNESFAFTLL